MSGKRAGMTELILGKQALARSAAVPLYDQNVKRALLQKH